MKIAIIGGAGVRVPLLVNGLASAALGIDEFALYDPDQPRLKVIAELSARRAGAARVTTHASATPAIDGAAFVITSIRVGGIEARMRDEQAALSLGFVGQETVGPGGFAMAVRTIPPLVAYAREVTRRAPGAWIINFTNPAGLVTQALTAETGARVIGICDTPTEVFQEIAHALGAPADECHFDYIGLNHLGFVREVFWRGTPQLARLWDDGVALARVYRTPLFSPARLRDLRLLPTEYVFYYESPERAVANLRAAGETRGRCHRAADAASSSTTWRRACRSRWRVTSGTWRSEALATCSSSPAGKAGTRPPPRGRTSRATTRSRSTPSRPWCGTRTPSSR